MTKIFHLANFNSTNVGNGALISATERVLREDFGSNPVSFIAEPWDDYNFGRKFDQNLVDRINTESDCFLVGGAVAINGREYLNQAGWRLDFPPALLQKIEVPIVIGGISYRFWQGQKFHHLDRFSESVNVLLARANTWFGVRNDGTKQWLEDRLGRKLDQIQTVPDPALFVETRPCAHAELSDSIPNVILALNSEDEDARFPGPDGVAQRRHIMQDIAAALTAIHDDVQAFNLILCPHYLDDFRMIGEFINFLPPRIAHRYTVAAGMYRGSRSAELYDLYRSADLSISMRVHSMSPSIGLGTPTIPLTSQGRMEVFLNDIGLSDIGISVFSADLQSSLFSRIQSALAQPSKVRERFAAATSDCRDRIRGMTTSTMRLCGVH